MREKARVEPLRRNDATHIATARIGKVDAFVIWGHSAPWDIRDGKQSG